MDAYTVEKENIESVDLMERAAAAFVRKYAEVYGKGRSVVVFAGPGNNGGDALAVARLLREHAAHISVYLFNTGKGLSRDCLLNKKRLETHVLGLSQYDFTEVTTQFTPPQLPAGTLVVDGLFGTGLDRPLTGGFAAVVKYINASQAEVVSIDVPSGLMTEDNSTNILSSVVRATRTFTFHSPKLSFFLPRESEYVGEWSVLDIGLQAPPADELKTHFHLTSASDLLPLLHTRPRTAHKGLMGHGLLIAGQPGMAGAAVLASRSAMRGGLGKLTVHVQEPNRAVLQVAVPEAVLHVEPAAGDPADQKTHTASKYSTLAMSISDRYDAIAIGPGIGTDERTCRGLADLLPFLRMSTVLDADALNIIGRYTALQSDLPLDSILTPHRGELERIIGPQTDDYCLLTRTMDFAHRHSVYVLVKGAFSAVVTPQYQVYFNPTGNPGMATAGSGDVLTGLLLSLLSQQYTSEEALRIGVYLHGLAGDLAAADLSEDALTASDLVDYLPRAWRHLRGLAPQQG